MIKRTGILFAALVALLFFYACEHVPNEDAPQGEVVVEQKYNKMLILNEGPMGNNASLSLLDLGNDELHADWFSESNGRGLGNVAQDIVIYGSKAYISVWRSGTLEVLDTATGISTKYDMGDRSPRYIATDGGKLYISCYNPHSVVRIDTARMEVEATCTLGGYNPEGLAVVGNKLYVTSDNISDATGNYTYDNKLYVIDLDQFEVFDSIEVGVNPQYVMAIDNHTLVVNFWGEWDLNDYSTVGEGSALVDVTTGEVRQLNQLLTKMTVSDGMVYGYASDYSTAGEETKYLKLNPAMMQVEEILVDCGVNDPYSIAVHPVSHNIYIGTHNNYRANGDLRCYSSDGTFLWKREVGMLPSKVVFF